MDLSGVRTLRIAACDLNGQMRGKWLPVAYTEKLEQGGARMPLSALNVDLWGADIDGSPLVFETGDADGVLSPTGRGPVPVPWSTTPSALIPMQMFHDDGTPFAGDPRHALVSVLDRYARRGWSVMAATELEFTLLDDSGPAPQPVNRRNALHRPGDSAILSLAELDSYQRFFDALYAGCEAMGIPAQAALSESGVGQFEVNLSHQDALRCADDTWLFKSLVRGLARQNGFAATFMAKPMAGDAGNGMHVHFSVLERDGINLFDDGGAQGTDTLRHAIAGCLAALHPATLVFAPHGNSYQRLVPGAHAPTGVCWAHENRTASIRIPGGPPAARRIEHRVPGGDTNPYLVLAAILGAAMLGIEDAMTPPAPISGNAYAIADLPQLAPDLASAIDAFTAAPMMAQIFPRKLIDNLCRTKRQEIAGFAARAPETHWLSYLETV